VVAGPAACAVPEPRRRYTGETRFPLLGQNLHRYFLYAALAFNVILSWTRSSRSTSAGTSGSAPARSSW